MVRIERIPSLLLPVMRGDSGEANERLCEVSNGIVFNDDYC